MSSFINKTLMVLKFWKIKVTEKTEYSKLWIEMMVKDFSTNKIIIQNSSLTLCKQSSWKKFLKKFQITFLK